MAGLLQDVFWEKPLEPIAGNFGIILYCDCSAGKGAVPSTADSGGCGTSGGSNLSIAADDNIPVIISFFSAADAGTITRWHLR